MEKEYYLFDFQELIEEIREKEGTKEGKEDLLKLLDKIKKEGLDLEDLPFYKNILSKFDIENAFKGYELEVDPDIGASEADYDILQRFIYGSLSSEYAIDFDNYRNMVSLSITVKSKEEEITKSLDELWSFQIVTLFRIYLNEQFNIEVFCRNEKDGELLQKHLYHRLDIFEKTVNDAKAAAGT